MDQHEEVIKEAIQKNLGYKWLVATTHFDIYGVGQWHSQGDSKAKREKFEKLFEKYKFDVVLTGHDHAYSRLYQISDTQSADSYKVNKVTLQDGIVKDPIEILYITGNCCTGSKYYPVHPDVKNLSYAAKSWQGDDPSYSIIDMTDSSFTIKTYDAYKDQLIDDAYTIVKTKNIVKVDKSELKKSVTEVENTLENAVEGQKDGQYKEGSIDELKEVIAPAKVLLNDDNANQEDVDGTVKSLNQNLAEFNKKKIVVDRSPLEEKITEAKDCLSKAEEGTKKGNTK